MSRITSKTRYRGALINSTLAKSAVPIVSIHSHTVVLIIIIVRLFRGDLSVVCRVSPIFRCFEIPPTPAVKPMLQTARLTTQPIVFPKLPSAKAKIAAAAAKGMATDIKVYCVCSLLIPPLSFLVWIRGVCSFRPPGNQVGLTRHCSALRIALMSSTARSTSPRRLTTI